MLTNDYATSPDIVRFEVFLVGDYEELRQSVCTPQEAHYLSVT
jgi:hypothetical protein